MDMRRLHGDQVDVDMENSEKNAESQVKKVKVTPEEMDGREAFFALMAMKMMHLA